MSALTHVAKRGRPLFRKTGFDLVRFPGIRHTHLRGRTMRRLGIDLVLDVGANVGQFAEDVRDSGYRGEDRLLRAHAGGIRGARTARQR